MLIYYSLTSRAEARVSYAMVSAKSVVSMKKKGF